MWLTYVASDKSDIEGLREEKGMLSSLQQKIEGFFHTCEYIKECDKLTPQCRHGGNSYYGEYKKRTSKKLTNF
jgi:hypothetical protein